MLTHHVHIRKFLVTVISSPVYIQLLNNVGAFLLTFVIVFCFQHHQGASVWHRSPFLMIIQAKHFGTWTRNGLTNIFFTVYIYCAIRLRPQMTSPPSLSRCREHGDDKLHGWWAVTASNLCDDMKIWEDFFSVC